jgi:hypothetical protein
MKYAVKPLLTLLGAVGLVVGLCSCESLPSTDQFDRDGYVPSREEALSDAYHGWRSEVGAGGANIEKMRSFYTPNW